MKQPDTRTAITIAKGMLSLGFIMAAGFYAYSQFGDDEPKAPETAPPATVTAPPPQTAPAPKADSDKDTNTDTETEPKTDTPSAETETDTAPEQNTAPQQPSARKDADEITRNAADNCIYNVLETKILPSLTHLADDIRTEDSKNYRAVTPQIIARFAASAESRFSRCEDQMGIERSAASNGAIERVEQAATAFEKEFMPKP